MRSTRSVMGFLLLISITATAQTSKKLNYGVKAGLNLSNTKYKTGDANENLGSRSAFHAGAFVSKPINNVCSINLEALYSSEGYKKSEDDRTSTLELNYINIPILFRYQHSSGIYGETGPQVGLLMSLKSIYEVFGNTTENTSKKNYKSNDFSWAIGLGYRYKHFSLGARYNLGLMNIYKTGNEYSYIPSTLQLGVSYFIK